MNEQSKISHTDTKKTTLKQITAECMDLIREGSRYDRLIQSWNTLYQLNWERVFKLKMPLDSGVQIQIKETDEALVKLRDQFDALKSMVLEADLADSVISRTSNDAGFFLYNEVSENAIKWLEMVHDKAFDELDRINGSREDTPHQNQECDTTKHKTVSKSVVNAVMAISQIVAKFPELDSLRNRDGRFEKAALDTIHARIKEHEVDIYPEDSPIPGKDTWRRYASSGQTLAFGPAKSSRSGRTGRSIVNLDGTPTE